MGPNDADRRPPRQTHRGRTRHLQLSGVPCSVHQQIALLCLGHSGSGHGMLDVPLRVWPESGTVLRVGPIGARLGSKEES
jgi:hypothetical protein